MKALWFLPLAFIAGEHGFALFAPYLALVAVVLTLPGLRKPRPVPVAVQALKIHKIASVE
jgi:hypothetical protein